MVLHIYTWWSQISVWAIEVTFVVEQNHKFKCRMDLISWQWVTIVILQLANYLEQAIKYLHAWRSRINNLYEYQSISEAFYLFAEWRQIWWLVQMTSSQCFQHNKHRRLTIINHKIYEYQTIFQKHNNSNTWFKIYFQF